MLDLPPQLEILPRRRVVATVAPPGSKSITNRALLVAALAGGTSRLRRPLHSDDTEAMRDCLTGLGVQIEDDGEDLAIRSTGRLSPVAERLDARGSGTTARFVTGAATLADGPVVIDGNQRMRERPIGDLVDALRMLGANLEIRGNDGCPPVWVGGGGLDGGPAEIDASRSSQYVSAVMMAAPYAAAPVELELRGPVVSRPYLQTTLEVMAAFGIEASLGADDVVRIPTGEYTPLDFSIEADASAAAYPWAAAAVTGGDVTVLGIDPSSTQADVGFLRVLEAMGCEVRVDGSSIAVVGPERLRGAEVDMNDCPDAVLAAAVCAAFADGPTTIRDIGNLRIKETDRLAALETELRKLGAGAEAGEDWLRVEPRQLAGALIETYDDHRMAMSFAVAGLAVPGVVIDDPGCVVKTWPTFFEELERW